MGKRKVKRSSELRNIKRRKEEDSKLQGSVFTKIDSNDEISDVEIDDIVSTKSALQGKLHIDGELDDEDAELNDEQYQASKRKLKDEELEDEFEDYEIKPRAFNDPDEGEEGLPIRKADGTMQRRIIKKVEKKESTQEKSDDELDSEDDSADKSDEKKNSKDADKEEESIFNEEDDEAYKGLTQEEKIIKTKEDIADMAEKLIEDPEENIMLLSRLRRMATSKNPLTAKLAILAMVPVFKSISPSYHIRPLSEAEKKEKVSREVAKLRVFEQHMVINYRHYIDLLTKKASKFSTQPKVSTSDAEMGIIAANAACELASSLRFFNYRKEIFKLIIRRVMKKPQNEFELRVFKKCVNTLDSLLIEDASNGDISLENDYAPNAGEHHDDEVTKMKKKDRVYLSKKQRKQLKERKLIDEEMRNAEQAITAEQREKNQAQILKMLLTFYLEILKARPAKLMAAVLESLSKFGHMVNIDLMGDFLQVLREITEDILLEKDLNSNEVRQVLLCIITSFSLVANLPSKKVVVDLNKFVDYLYSLLPNLSLDTEIEFSHKTLRLMDPLSTTDLNMKPSVNVSTKAELLLRCLNAIFFNSKSGSSKRALAFTKRLYLALLHLPEKTDVALLKFLDKLLGRFDDMKTLYSTEDRVQNGVYNPEVDETERANTEVAVLWENVLLDNHYATNVQMGARHLFKMSK
jgi:nucleolar complex protein 3